MEGYVSISVRKADKRKKEKGTDRRSILFLLFAVYGLLFLVGSVEGVDVDLPVFFLSAVPCLLLWGAGGLGKVFMYVSYGLMLVGSGVAFYFFRDVFCGQWLYMGNCIFKITDTFGMDVSWTLLWSSVVLSLFLFFMECIVRLHWPLYLLGTACFIAAPFLGISLSLPAVFCLVGFQILFWHVHIIERYGKKKLFLSGEKRSLRSSVWMLAWLSLLFTAAVLLVNLSPRRFYDAAFAVEGLVQRTLLRADDRLIDPVSGTVNRGNLYPADVPQLVVTSTKQPTQILYLKGFSGDDYHNGQWQEADDTAILQNINENTLHWGNWSDWLFNLYSSMYFVMNQMMIREEPLQPDILMVMPTTARQNQWYQPYFSIWRRDEGQGGYYYEFFEQKDVDIDWDNVPDQLTTARDWYYAIQNAYMQEAQNEYTQVSETDIPTLAQFVRDHPMEDLDQITGFILQTLEGATYTRTPGFFAMDEDPVEYFLFESEQGYCQHFASAAVLMYRLYGVPARYTAGYAVSPDDFVLREDGTYQAMVTDASAHAWPEIYLEDFGWVPVEVTPAADGTISPSYPGFDPEKVQQPDQAETTRPELEAEMPKEERKEPALSDRQQTRLMDAAPILPFIYLAAVCVLQVGPILWHLRKERKRRWLERGGSLRVFSRMMDMLHFGGWLGEYDGSESDFAGKLSRQIPTVSGEEADNMMEVVYRAAYGSDDGSRDKDYETVKSVYDKVAVQVYQNQTACKKFLFRCLKMYFV